MHHVHLLKSKNPNHQLKLLFLYHNDKLSLKLWHYERIVQLLIQNIGIIYPITPVTQELGYKNKCLAIVIRKDANVNNPGTRIANLNRILEDQREIFDKRKKNIRGFATPFSA